VPQIIHLRHHQEAALVSAVVAAVAVAAVVAAAVGNDLLE